MNLENQKRLIVTNRWSIRQGYSYRPFVISSSCIFLLLVERLVESRGELVGNIELEIAREPHMDSWNLELNR